MSNDSDNSSNQFIPVNQVLNHKPQLGPIPGEQVIPWIAIMIGSYLLCQGILGLNWIATCLISVWGIGSWWVLTGNESWRFLNKFQRVPGWTRGHLPYTSLLDKQKNIASPHSSASRSHYKRRSHS